MKIQSLFVILILLSISQTNSIECVPNCDKCNNNTECLECTTNYYLLSNNQCSECPYNYYYSRLNTCSICSEAISGCNTCSSANLCLSCVPYHKLISDNLCEQCTPYNLICQTGQYRDLYNCECKNCIDNCDLCNNTQECIACTNNYYLTDEKKCSTCPLGQYYSGTNTCSRCSSKMSNCERCSNANNCTKCRTYYKLESSSVCKHCAMVNLNCGEGYYKYMVQCICRQCKPDCKTCSNGQSCDSCHEGYYYDSQVRTCKQCETSCPSGYILNGCECQLHNNYMGCYKDTSNRDLDKYLGNNFTIESCRVDCKKNGYAYAGVQFHGQCFCGNSYGGYGTVTNCDKTCSQDNNHMCGGSWANSVFSTDWFSIGCHQDKNSRDLAHFSGNLGSVDSCIQECQSKGYAYAGVQNGNQCFCDSKFGKYGVANNCQSQCQNQSEQICGGAWANNIYGVVTNRIYLGCYKDQNQRDLSYFAGDNKSIQQCVNECSQKGYQYAGLQFHGQCFCGNTYGSYGTSSNCDKTCNANNSQICGGSWANSIYEKP